MIPLQSYHIFIHEVFFFFFSTLWYDGEFIHWKIKHTSWLLVQNLLICPEKTLATRGIDRKLSANGKLIDKCGIYAAHCSDCMTDTRKQCGQATLQGKYSHVICVLYSNCTVFGKFFETSWFLQWVVQNVHWLIKSWIQFQFWLDVK